MGAQRTTSPHLGEDEWAIALELHERFGQSIHEIAERCGVAYGTAWRHLRELGARRRKPPAWHSLRGMRLYSAWRSMRQRCKGRSSRSFTHYGGRGIGICPEWEQFEHFWQWALRSGYRRGLGLALIDPDRDYGPRNCRWIGKRERVRRRLEKIGPGASTCMVRAFGEVKSIGGWSQDPRCRISTFSLRKRLRAGVRPEAAITSPRRARWDPALPKARKPALAPVAARTAIDWPGVVELHRARGWSVSAIAAHLGLGYTTVWKGLRQRGKYRTPVGRGRTPDSHRVYLLWQSIMSRTTDPASPMWASNGKQGVRVCKAWQDFETFFRWALASGSKPQLCLARERLRGPYSPGNCRWITRSEHMLRVNRERRIAAQSMRTGSLRRASASRGRR